MKTFFKKCSRDLSGFLDRIFSESTVSVMKLLKLLCLIAFVVALCIKFPWILMWALIAVVWALIAVGIVFSLFVVSSVLGPNDSPLFFVVMVPIAIAALTILVMLDFISNMVILALSNKNAMILEDPEIDGFSYGF